MTSPRDRKTFSAAITAGSTLALLSCFGTAYGADVGSSSRSSPNETGIARYRYSVVRGDTLSDIVWALVPGRLYGPNGALRRVERMNGLLSDPDRLEGDRIIYLPDGTAYRFERIHPYGASEARGNANFWNFDEVAKRLVTIVSEVSRPIVVPSRRLPVNARAVQPSVPPNEPTAAHPEPHRPTQPANQLADQPALSTASQRNVPPANRVPPPISVRAHLPTTASAFERIGDAVDFSATYRFSALSLRDTNTESRSTIATNLYPGIRFVYSRETGTRFRPYVRFVGAYVDFEAPVERDRTIAEADHLTYGFGFGTLFRVSPHFAFGLEAAYEKELFGRAIDTDRLSVDAVSVPELSARVEWTPVTKSSFSISLAPTFTSFVSTRVAGYTARPGFAAGGILKYERIVGGKSGPWNAEAGFSRRTENLSDVDQRENRLFFNLTFRHRIGKGV